MSKQAVTKVEETAVIPAGVLERMRQSQGRGLSQSAADNIVPMIYVLQGLSPQVNKRNADVYIEGAEPGAIWLRNSTDPIVDGNVGLLFQPCYFYKEWVEWVPRDAGGGFVGRHPNKVVGANDVPDIEEARSRINDETNQVEWFMPNGNELVLTRYHAGFVLGRGTPEPYVIPLTSTGHQFSRNWMYRMNTKILPGSNQPAESWYCVYRLKTVAKRNQKGEWYQWAVEEAAMEYPPVLDAQGRVILPAGFVREEVDLDRGEALYKSFAGGEKQAEAPVAPTTADSQVI